MPTHRHRLTALVAASAALVGCGQREPERVTETPPPSQEQRMPEPAPSSVALAVADPGVSQQMQSPQVVVRIDDRPEGYWSVTSDELANVGAKPTATVAPALAPRSGKEAPAKTWSQVDAGTLVMPNALHPGRIDDRGSAPGRELWLIELPITFAANQGFDKPLTRIDLAFTLEGKEEQKGDWTVMPVKDVGFTGLRHGPNPMPDGPFQYWFRSDQLLPALSLQDGRHRAGWSLRHADGSTIPSAASWYGVLATPRGARSASATVEARLWFSAGYEATAFTTPTRIAIDLASRAQ